jgi:hypothetical protein
MKDKNNHKALAFNLHLICTELAVIFLEKIIKNEKDYGRGNVSGGLFSVETVAYMHYRFDAGAVGTQFFSEP